ncbi:transcription termination factor MTEF1, chloroplastic-like [Rhododendron vialii]|uniref:transcription termination factor MTEF1, chloroplastic-like n=1 Tax=Rhododendron vialii TaxID=182163 RepID=UPI00265DE3B1|nr:transcription termination factor MTEF1, chloroplastic-like [Rhododendron vialii]
MQTLFLKCLYPKPNNSTLLCFFSSLSSLSHSCTSNPSLCNFLIETLAFSEPRAVSISNRFPPTKTLQKPLAVIQLLRQFGLSDIQIQSSVRVAPQILFSDVEKTLKPMLLFFQDLGLTGPELGKFISKHSKILHDSLEKKWIPYIDMIKKTLVNDKNNQDLIKVLQKYRWVVSKPELKLKRSIAFLESCGIVGSQLSMLLRSKPGLFFQQEPALRDLILRVLDMGFSVNSRMLVHAVHAVSGISGETFSRKFEMFRSFGFSMDECMDMFRRAPRILTTSEDNLKFKIDFFLNDIKLDRCALVSGPNCLTYSMEKRVIPRYRVLQVIKSKRLLQKGPRFLSVLCLSEEEFLRKFISSFRDDGEVLLGTYKGNPLDS